MSVVVEAATPARELCPGQVVRVAFELFAVEAVHRHITRDDLVHVILRTTKGGVLIVERSVDAPMDVVEVKW